MKVAVANLKGGTAKTLTSFFLATALSRRGRTLLVDCDPQGSALSWAGAAEEGGEELPFPVVGLPVKDVHRRIKKIEGDYDHVVLDTPPGELTIARSALRAADMAVVAVPPPKIDLDRVMPTLELVADVEDETGLSFYVLLTRVKRISREGREARELMGEMGLPVMEAEIPFLALYSDAFGAPIAELGEYERVARELLGEPVAAGEASAR
ncbi:MAG: ParA family protein [Actinomycetota bacterium]|nr:ParA family protein [Actinomycetota bacterium]